jgi:hypothetical protein
MTVDFRHSRSLWAIDRKGKEHFMSGTEFTRNNVSILHMKAIVDSPAGFVKAAICGNGQEPAVKGVLAASPALKHDLIFNLRALGEAGPLHEIVEQQLDRTDAKLVGLHLDCFHPAAPKPERRVAKRAD